MDCPRPCDLPDGMRIEAPASGREPVHAHLGGNEGPAERVQAEVCLLASPLFWGDPRKNVTPFALSPLPVDRPALPLKPQTPPPSPQSKCPMHPRVPHTLPVHRGHVWSSSPVIPSHHGDVTAGPARRTRKRGSKTIFPRPRRPGPVCHCGRGVTITNNYGNASRWHKRLTQALELSTRI